MKSVLKKITHDPTYADGEADDLATRINDYERVVAELARTDAELKKRLGFARQDRDDLEEAVELLGMCCAALEEEGVTIPDVNAFLAKHKEVKE